MEVLVVLGFCIAIAVALRAGRDAAAGFQTRGEAKVSSVLMARFPPPDYHLLNHLTLGVGVDTTQIDHVLVSRFGIFVIETKDHNGWIYGSERDRQWTQVFYRVRYRFQNPIHQNYKHVCTVRALLDFLPPDSIRSVVVFTGRAKFQTPMVNGVIALEDLGAYVSGFSSEVMSINRLQFCVGRLETARLALTRETDLQHVARLRKRFGGD